MPGQHSATTHHLGIEDLIQSIINLIQLCIQRHTARYGFICNILGVLLHSLQHSLLPWSLLLQQGGWWLLLGCVHQDWTPPMPGCLMLI